MVLENAVLLDEFSNRICIQIKKEYVAKKPLLSREMRVHPLSLSGGIRIY